MCVWLTISYKNLWSRAISVKQLAPPEADGSSAIPKIPRNLWNPKFHYRNHNSPPRVSLMSQSNSYHVLTYYLSSILISSAYLRLGLPRGLFMWGIYTIFSAPPSHKSHATSTSFFFVSFQGCTYLQFKITFNIVIKFAPSPVGQWRTAEFVFGTTKQNSATLWGNREDVTCVGGNSYQGRTASQIFAEFWSGNYRLTVVFTDWMFSSNKAS